MKVFISSDSSCDLLPEQIKENDVSIIPIYVMLGGEEHLDGVDVDEQTIFDYVKATKKLPKTSAIPRQSITTNISQFFTSAFQATFQAPITIQ